MKRKCVETAVSAAVLLMLCAVIFTGCGDEYAPDYLVLVNKENPVSLDYADSIELVKIRDAGGDCTIPSPGFWHKPRIGRICSSMMVDHRSFQLILSHTRFL